MSKDDVLVRSRHASVIGLINFRSSEGISPDGAFDVSFSAKRVLAAASGTKFVKEGDRNGPPG